MTVGAFCNREVVVASPYSGIAEAARLMREHHVGDLVIVEGERRVPVGILTDRDLVVEVLAEGVEPDVLAVGDAMSRDVVTANEDDSLWMTLQRMRSKGVRRVPIVDRQGGLVGILTMDDLLELLTNELADLAKVINREQDRERTVRC